MTEEHHHCSHEHCHEHNHEHECHCHDHHHDEPFHIEYTLKEEEQLHIDELMTTITSQSIHELKDRMSENSEVIKYVISDNRLNIILKQLTQYLFPTIQMNDIVKEIISFIDFLSKTQYKMFIFVYNIPQKIYR